MSELDEYDEYESLPNTATATTHMIAGSLAGILEHCVMYPVDSVKTRLQSLVTDPTTKRSIGSVMMNMIREEGALRPLRGMGAMVAGAGPAHALYFGSYERLKVAFNRSGSSANQNYLAQGAAGSVATLLHDAIMTPAEVVKQRLQMYNSPYRSMLECGAKVYRAEGLAAFYRAYGTQVVMNVPFQSVHFMVYEAMQNQTNPDRAYNPKAHVISGGISGAVAAAITTPLDVCKTLLNTQEAGALEKANQKKITGLVNAATTVYRIGGFSGFFQGMGARVLYQMPSTAICWTVYEFFKYFLTKDAAERSARNEAITYDKLERSTDIRPTSSAANAAF